MRKAMEAGDRSFRIKPVLSPKDMTNPEVEHLAIMAYATHLQFVTPRAPMADMVAVHLQSTAGRVGDPVREDLSDFLNTKFNKNHFFPDIFPCRSSIKRS